MTPTSGPAGGEPPTPPPTPGARLAERRRQIGLSEDELSLETGIPVEVLAAYEAGRQPIPDPILRELAELLEVPLAYFRPDAA